MRKHIKPVLNVQRKNNSMKTFSQFLYYAIVGVITNAIGYSLFLVMTYFGVDTKLAASVLYLFCATLSFFGNKRYTFNKMGGSLAAFYFMITYSLGYLINMALLIYFVDHLKFPYYEIEAIAIIIVSAFIFMTSKLFIFRDARKL